MRPIYEPKGKAKEYGDLALNIYTGCPHKCYYCFAPNVLRKNKEQFHSCIEARKNIVEETRKQIKKENIHDKLIHLCFTCDPYPFGYDNTTTREIIKLLKETGNHVQILTKNGKDAMRDFDLLDENDWFGITYAGYNGPVYNEKYVPEAEPCAGTPYDRLYALKTAYDMDIKTWVSAEPVLAPEDVLDFIKETRCVDLWKIGKLNYHPSDVNWRDFGHNVENLLKSQGAKYYIKDSLRKEME